QTRTGSTTRYTLLETIREFCQGNVAEARLRELQGRHAAYYGRAIETATGVSPDSLEMPKVELSDRDSTVVPPEWLSAIEPDYENFVSAIARLEQDDRGRAARIATLLAPYILARGCLVEGEFLLKRVTSPAGEDQAVDGAALMMAAAIALEQNRVEEAEGLLRRSADVCRRFELVDVSIQAR